jgi:hypothetical protein
MLNKIWIGVCLVLSSWHGTQVILEVVGDSPKVLDVSLHLVFTLLFYSFARAAFRRMQ